MAWIRQPAQPYGPTEVATDRSPTPTFVLCLGEFDARRSSIDGVVSDPRDASRRREALERGLVAGSRGKSGAPARKYAVCTAVIACERPPQPCRPQRVGQVAPCAQARWALAIADRTESLTNPTHQGGQLAVGLPLVRRDARASVGLADRHTPETRIARPASGAQPAICVSFPDERREHLEISRLVLMVVGAGQSVSMTRGNGNTNV